MKTETITTIRIPRDLWIRLRRLQEQGKIKSIQQATIKGLEMVAEGRE